MDLYKKTNSDIFDRIRKLNLPIGDYAVFGSSLMDVWGLRKSIDLDIVVTPRLYNKLKNEGWEEKQCTGFTLLIKDDANLSTVQTHATKGDYNPDRMQLIKDAILIDGIPFVRIEEVIACKAAYNRPKDLEDIARIKEYIKEERLALYEKY